MNTENITRVRRLDLNTVLYSGSAYQSQGSSAAGHWIKTYIYPRHRPNEEVRIKGNILQFDIDLLNEDLNKAFILI